MAATLKVTQEEWRQTSLTVQEEPVQEHHISAIEGFMKLTNLINLLQCTFADLLKMASDLNSSTIDAENADLQNKLKDIQDIPAPTPEKPNPDYATKVQAATSAYNNAQGKWQGYLQKLQCITDSLQTITKALPTDANNEIQGAQSFIEALKTITQLIQSGTGA